MDNPFLKLWSSLNQCKTEARDCAAHCRDLLEYQSLAPAVETVYAKLDPLMERAAALMKTAAMIEEAITESKRDSAERQG